MGQLELLTRAVAALEDAEVPYMLSGSYASSLQGQPRATHDIDIVVELQPGRVGALLRAFPEDRFYFSREAVDVAVRERRMFNILDTEDGDKIDFWMLTDDPFDQERFARRITVPFAGRSLAVSTPEDTILMKLRWAAESDGSERQTEDARRVYQVSLDQLDNAYLDRWAIALGVETALRQVRAE